MASVCLVCDSPWQRDIQQAALRARRSLAVAMRRRPTHDRHHQATRHVTGHEAAHSLASLDGMKFGEDVGSEGRPRCHGCVGSASIVFSASTRRIRRAASTASAVDVDWSANCRSRDPAWDNRGGSDSRGPTVSPATPWFSNVCALSLTPGTAVPAVCFGHLSHSRHLSLMPLPALFAGRRVAASGSATGPPLLARRERQDRRGRARPLSAQVRPRRRPTPSTRSARRRRYAR